MSHANEIYDRRLSDAVVPTVAATALFGEAPVVFYPSAFRQTRPVRAYA